LVVDDDGVVPLPVAPAVFVFVPESALLESFD